MSKRLDRVNELLRREISAVIQREFEWQGSLVTVSAVDVTQDLKEAKVFVSVLGGSQSGLEKHSRAHLPPRYLSRARR